MTDVIETRQVTKIYQGGVDVHVLRGIDLRIPAASFVAIMGPSGSGKSTLLHILSGLESPTTGQVLLDGVDVGGMSDGERSALRRRRIGFVFQQFNLLPIFSAVENVALPLRLEGVGHDLATQRAEQALAFVGMTPRRNHLPSQLSGGEQQRVAIARAMAPSPAIVLADEPTGNLDSVNGERVIAILRSLVDEQRQTIVMVTHDAAIACRADRVISMQDGLIVADAARGETPIRAEAPAVGETPAEAKTPAGGGSPADAETLAGGETQEPRS